MYQIERNAQYYPKTGGCWIQLSSWKDKIKTGNNQKLPK